jgi:hypothetical protein
MKVIGLKSIDGAEKCDRTAGSPAAMRFAAAPPQGENRGKSEPWFRLNQNRGSNRY